MARLPRQNEDAGAWGDILNEFLSVVHNPDGSLKPINESGLNLASDAAPDTPSRRSLGNGARQAVAGNDVRLPASPVSEPDNRWLVTKNGSIVYTNAPYIPRGTDISLADGGTGASSAAEARTNLGVISSSGGGVELYQDHGSAGSSETIDLANGNVHRIVLSAASCTLTIVNATPAAACSLTLIIVQNPSGGSSITWPSSVKWPGGIVANIGTLANAVSIVTLLTVDGGSTWQGMLAGASFS